MLLGRTLPDQASVQDPMKPKACPSCLVAQALGHQLKRNPVWAGGMSSTTGIYMVREAHARDPPVTRATSATRQASMLVEQVF